MRISTTGALVDELRQYQLLSADRLAQLPSLAKAPRSDARVLAKTLGQKGWLSVYQINQLLSGNAKELVYGPYHIVERLGAGGLSNVFKAYHALDHETIALKVIKPEVMADPEGRAQFLHEIEAISKLEHPNIVQFYDADEADDTFYCAMEFLDGTDLGKLLRLSGRLPVTQACECLRQAALGLQHAHERNLVHRDIKPVNLMLTSEKVHAVSRRGKKIKKSRPLIKILDWGLASIRCSNGKNSKPSTRGIVGTADYLAPEQATSPDTVDIRGDIYSLGCTLYALLTGRPPFPNGTLMQKLLQHQKEEPEPVESVRGDVSAGLSAVLQRMMAKGPDQRFQTPAAVALALAPFTQAAPAPVPVPRPAEMSVS
jgi:serine/threonine protein kinase